MGKRSHKRKSRCSVYDCHPGAGCLWGIMLNVVEYHHWGYFRKRLPHWKHGRNKQARGDGYSENNKASDSCKWQYSGNDQVNKSNVEEKGRRQEATPANKETSKSQMKALINEESPKRKGIHQRTSAYSARSILMRTDSIHHHLKPSYEEFFAETVSDDENPRTNVNESSRKSNGPGSMLSKSLKEPIANEETYEDRQVTPTQNDLVPNLIDKNENQLEQNHVPLQQNVDDSQALSEIDRKEIVTDAPPYRSEEFENALDIIHLNKEFLMKILHDPSSPLAHYFHSQQTLSARMGLSKSVSFPSPSLSSSRSHGPNKLKQQQNVIVPGEAHNSIECESVEDMGEQSNLSKDVEHREDGIRQPNQEMTKIGDSSSSGAAQDVKNRDRNQVVIKRFKDLKKKIKLAIKVSKNEGHRITSDAVLHKIPCGQSFSADFRKETYDHLKDPFIKNEGKNSPARSINESYHTALSGNSGLQSMRRASSLSTLKRYSQCYETSFNRKTKQHISGGLKLRREEPAVPSRKTPKSLGRILSLPGLKSDFYQCEDSSDAFPSSMLVRAPVEESASTSSSDEESIIDMPIAAEDYLQLGTLAKGQTEENWVKVKETDSVTCSNADAKVRTLSDDLSNLTTRDSTFDEEREIEPVTCKPPEPSPVSVLDLNFQEIAESTSEYSVSEDSEAKPGYLLPRERDSLTSYEYEPSMDAYNVAHCSDYEKIEISSNNLHIDLPQVQVAIKDTAKFDYVKNVLELAGFSGNESLGTWQCDYQPLDPSMYHEVEGCILFDPDCSANEGGNCDHMHLFGLINEVLMEIYERSYSYYPKSLSSLCQIHPMPAGYNVLKQVWENISRYLSFRPEIDQPLNYIATRDLSNDEWMNLQFDSECVGIELEDLIFEDLLEEAIFS